jgi:hypothetical protein
MTSDEPVLLRKEIYWRDRQQWLETRGYMLRPRYRPGWKASWIGTSNFALFSEDGPSLKVHTLFLTGKADLYFAIRLIQSWMPQGSRMAGSSS